MRTLTITCDYCRREIEEKDVFRVEQYIHASPAFNRIAGHGKMIEAQIRSISVRTETKTFCPPCYNYLFPADPIVHELSAIRADLAAVRAVLETMQPRPLPDLLTRREAAAELGVSVRTVDNYARAWRLEKIQTSAGVRFRRVDVEKMKQSLI